MMIGYLLGGAVAAGAVCLVRSAYERKHFVTEEYVIETEKLREEEHVFVFLSDLHDQQFGTDNTSLIQAIDQVHPDGVLIGGDLMVSHGKTDTTIAKRLVQQLAERYPVFYAYGNHESRMRARTEVYGTQFEEYVRELESCGVTMLRDENVPVGDSIMIAGAELENRYYKNVKNDMLYAGDLEKKLGSASTERFQILLSHSPLFFDAYEAWGADLSLAGHFHGGTIRLPWLGGVMTPQFQFFLPWCAGFFEKNHRYMIVSRGLGTHSINIRLNNKPQLIVVRVKKKTTF